jgi:hypothetical protein
MSQKIIKTSMCEKISWSGSYSDEKYRWKCNSCNTIYDSKTQASNCYDSDTSKIQTQKDIKKILSNFQVLKFVPHNIHLKNSICCCFCKFNNSINLEFNCYEQKLSFNRNYNGYFVCDKYKHF